MAVLGRLIILVLLLCATANADFLGIYMTDSDTLAFTILHIDADGLNADIDSAHVRAQRKGVTVYDRHLGSTASHWLNGEVVAGGDTLYEFNELTDSICGAAGPYEIRVVSFVGGEACLRVHNFIATDVAEGLTIVDDMAQLQAQVDSVHDVAVDQSVTYSGTADSGSSIMVAFQGTATTGWYAGQLVVITGGTGEGQARTILEYTVDGAVKKAVVTRDWTTAPDNTSEISVFAFDVPMILEAGTATGGTDGTIILDATASDINATYKDNFVTITGGTGKGQTRLITAYNGGTHSTSVVPDWVTNPDVTSIYQIYPGGRVDIGQISGDATAADNLEKDYDGTGYDNIYADEIDAADFVTDAIGADAIADSTFHSSMFNSTSMDSFYNWFFVTGDEVLDSANAINQHLYFQGLVDSSASGVWDLTTDGHTGAGSFGLMLESCSTGVHQIRDSAQYLLTATGFSTHSAADVWTVATRKITHFDEDDVTIDIDGTTIGTATNLTTNNDKTGYSISGTKTTLDALNDLSSSDNIGINWGNVTNQGTSVDLSATTIDAVDDVTGSVGSVTGDVNAKVIEIKADLIDDTTITVAAGDEIADQVLDEELSFSSHNNSGTFGSAIQGVASVQCLTIHGENTTTRLSLNLTNTNHDAYNGMFITARSGGGDANYGASRRITDYVAYDGDSARVFVSPAFPTVAGNSNLFVITASAPVDVGAISGDETSADNLENLVDGDSTSFAKVTAAQLWIEAQTAGESAIYAIGNGNVYSVVFKAPSGATAKGGLNCNGSLGTFNAGASFNGTFGMVVQGSSAANNFVTTIDKDDIGTNTYETIADSARHHMQEIVYDSLFTGDGERAAARVDSLLLAIKHKLLQLDNDTLQTITANVLGLIDSVNTVLDSIYLAGYNAVNECVGVGGYTCTLSVIDTANDVTVAGAFVSIQDSTESSLKGYTVSLADGNAVVSLSNGAYRAHAISSPTIFTPITFRIDDAALHDSILGYAPTISAPGSANLTTVVGDFITGDHDTLTSATVTIELEGYSSVIDTSTDVGVICRPINETCNGNGRLEVKLLRNENLIATDGDSLVHPWWTAKVYHDQLPSPWTIHFFIDADSTTFNLGVESEAVIFKK